MDNKTPDFEKTMHTAEDRASYEAPVSPPPPSGPAYPTEWPDERHHYSPGYSMYTPPKKKDNTLLIVLSACLAALVAILIAVCVIFVAKSAKTDTDTTRQKPDTSGYDDDTIIEDEEEEEEDVIEYVTYISNAEIYVRSEPTQNSDKILIIQGSDRSVRLKATDESCMGDDGYTWYEVEIPNGDIGWVRSDIVIEYDGPDTPMRKAKKSTPSNSGGGKYLVTAAPTSDIYIRNGPGTQSYRVIYVIAPGDTSVKLRYNYSKTGEDGYTWFNIYLPDGTNGWVRSDIVKWSY